MADRPCATTDPHSPHMRAEPGQPHDGSWCPGVWDANWIAAEQPPERTGRHRPGRISVYLVGYYTGAVVSLVIIYYQTLLAVAVGLAIAGAGDWLSNRVYDWRHR